LLQQRENQTGFGCLRNPVLKTDSLREKRLLQPLFLVVQKLRPQPHCVHNDALRENTIQEEKGLPIVKELAKEGEAAINSTPGTFLAGH
jgi:hypothetical protein